MIGAGAAGLAVLGCGAVVAMAKVDDALLNFFRVSLPGVKFDEASARTCIAEYIAGWPSWKNKVVAVGGTMVGIDRLTSVDPGFEKLARQCLTRFLRDSNFFHESDPRSALIVYTTVPDGTPCRNPFIATS
jgi:hypothetical protein